MTKFKVNLLAMFLCCFSSIISSKHSNKNIANTNLISEVINEFNFDIQRKISHKSDEENIIFSPFSISLAFNLLFAGAKGNTKQEIAHAFHWDKVENENLTLSINFLLNSISSQKTNNVFFFVANGAWVDESVNVSSSYQSLLESICHANFEKENFILHSDQARTKINKWIEKRTQNEIDNLFPKGAFDSTTRLVIANAIYFKSEWEQRFNEKHTKKDVFYLENGKTINANFMWMNSRLPFIYDRDVKVHLTELFYASKDFSMVIVVPQLKNKRINKLEGEITNKVFNSWLEKLNSEKSIQTIDLILPKFEVKHEINLKKVLQKLGIHDLFLESKANLSGINEKQNLHVSTALHKAFIKVDEHGTTAAAATGVGVSFLSMPPQIRANRPFLFYIINKRFNAVIFTGKVMQP